MNQVRLVFLCAVLSATLGLSETVPCSTFMAGSEYDLTSLSYNTYAGSPSGYSANLGGSAYYINFCRAVSHSISPECNSRVNGGSGSCQEPVEGVFNPAGDVNTMEFQQFTPDSFYSEGIAIRYTGSDCTPGVAWETTINVACDLSATVGYIYSVFSSGCSSTISFKSIHGCAVQNGTCSPLDLKTVGYYASAHVQGSTLNAPTGPGGCFSQPGQYQWYQVRTFGASTLTATTEYPATDFAAAVAIYSGSCTVPICMAGGSTSSSAAARSASIQAEANSMYYIAVGQPGEQGNFRLEVIVDRPGVPDSELVALVPGQPTQLNGTTVGAQAGVSPCSSQPINASWFTIVGPLPETIDITLVDGDRFPAQTMDIVSNGPDGLQCHAGHVVEAAFYPDINTQYSIGVYNLRPNTARHPFKVLITPNPFH